MVTIVVHRSHFVAIEVGELYPFVGYAKVQVCVGARECSSIWRNYLGSVQECCCIFPIFKH